MIKEQKLLVVKTMGEYIHTVNSLVSVSVSVAVNGTINKYITDVNANLPSALANQCIRDAKSIVKKSVLSFMATDVKTNSCKGNKIRASSEHSFCNKNKS